MRGFLTLTTLITMAAGAATAQPMPDTARYRVDLEAPSEGRTIHLSATAPAGGRADARDAGPGAHALSVRIDPVRMQGEDNLQAAIEISRTEDGQTVVLSSPRITFLPDGQARMSIETEDGPIAVSVTPAG
ncbi:hypothetical protein [Brevundimonas lutea]|uniref:hypothetical protein n=1 Tax=Brevundimonas lutea TaxID=2293980 RepID=UPI000F039A0A|nr:hypothetical protein [Brevundimonas lutea]